MTHKPETLLVHNSPIDLASGAIVPPLVFTTTFERDAEGEYPRGYVYTRSENPNRIALEQTIAKLEGGANAYGTASGSAAMMVIFQAMRPGDHIVSSSDMYFGIRVQLIELLAPWGLEHTFVDMTDLEAVKAAIQPNTKMIIFETPTNPMIRLADIPALADIAHENNALLLVDNTVATPIAQNPIALGADIVVHSLTKFIAGHHDVLGGMIVVAEETELALRFQRIIKIGGAVPSPMSCWLTLRGIQTLPYRMKGISENALKVANYLAEHPKIERVLYPHHPSHPQHDLAMKQMRIGSGLMSIQVKGGQDEAMGLTARLKIFTRATSFGGTHTLIEHRASVEEHSTTPQNLLRVSIGLENSDDLIDDMEQALA